jgi:hypothetical protein
MASPQDPISRFFLHPVTASLVHLSLCLGCLQDELFSLADDPDIDSLFRKAALDMDIMYHVGDTHQVDTLTR